MTVAKLLKSKRFIDFCFFEYGIEFSDLSSNYNAISLYKLMQKWYYCPETLWGPRGAMREEVKKALKDRMLLY